ncbi:MAG TPA: RNA-binding protein [Hyphomicrobiaceae bacterium]|nr:RNA-binding protein [Hyphomicrobiaceae bacterium]
MGATTTATRDDTGRRDCAAPLRLCAVTRTQRSVEDLVRFVLGPDGTIVPDLARRLPGRGVWVEVRRQTLADAVRRKVFARSLQQAVGVPEDLPEQVERLMVRRLAEAISLANKAGLLVTGFAKVEDLIAQGRAAVLIHAADGAADGSAKLSRKFQAVAGPEPALQATVTELPGLQLDLAIGRSNVVHAAASGGGAAQRILQEAQRLRRYRSGDPQPVSDPNTGRA